MITSFHNIVFNMCTKYFKQNSVAQRELPNFDEISSRTFTKYFTDFFTNYFINLGCERINDAIDTLIFQTKLCIKAGTHEHSRMYFTFFHERISRTFTNVLHLILRILVVTGQKIFTYITNTIHPRA